MPKNTETWRLRYVRWSLRRRAAKALALNKRGEVRGDGLLVIRFRNRLEIEWRARDVHPWDRNRQPAVVAQLFAEQCLDDANAAIERLFFGFPEVDVIDFKVLDLKSPAPIVSGAVTRAAAETVRATSAGMKLKNLGVNFRLHNWRFEPLS